jgi:regulatory protein
MGSPAEPVSGLPDPIEHALELAYAYLNRRDRTVSEVRTHLERRDLDPAAVDEALATLTDQGYLDDGRFARLFAQDKRELEQWGTERIRGNLAARGLDRELIDAALGGDSPETELERARALLERRFPSPPRDPRERERAVGVLLRKGYDSDTALDAVRAYARETADHH